MCRNVLVVQISSDATLHEAQETVNGSAAGGSSAAGHDEQHPSADTPRSAVFVDLDRTLLRGASGPVIDAALRAEGLLDGRPRLPAGRLLYGMYDLLGETLPMMALVRGAAQLRFGLVGGRLPQSR